jgi:hypothetical protein
MTAFTRVTFRGAETGAWIVESIRAVSGASLPAAGALTRVEAANFGAPDPSAAWSLRGVVSHERYLQRAERERLVAVQQGLGRGEPFDFLTWFEFSEADAGAFDELVGRLRETEEWRYVEREVEVRVRRGSAPSASRGS